MLAEMAPIYDRYDLLVTAGTYAAPRFDAHRTISFWEKPASTTPFNVTGGPALALCIGYNTAGLPLSMQIVGKPLANHCQIIAKFSADRRQIIGK